MHVAAKKKRERIFSKRRLKMDWPLYAMLALPVLLGIVFHYIPLVSGVIIAFQKYLPAKGVLHSKFVGFNNFTTLFNMPGFFRALRNTLTISLWKIALGVLVPVTFSILLNELRSQRVKKTVQTLIYLPHFISWVMLAGIFTKLLSGTGVVNKMLQALGIGPVMFLGDNHWFPFTIIFTHIWKEFGYGTIVYLAAIAGVNVDLYEASAVDGAGHFQQMVHVTIPAVIPTVILMTCLSVGSVLSAGFDQVYNMYNNVVLESGDILDTLTYRMGFDSGNFSLSAAASLFKSVVSCIFVAVSYRMSYRLSGYRVF